MPSPAAGRSSTTVVDGAAAPAERIAWMDDLRLTVIAGVVVVHMIGTYGVDVGWYEQGPRASAPVLDALAGPVWMALLFGLAPLFALAGWSAASSVDRHGPAGFARGRLARLGLPLAAYLAVIDPFTQLLASGTGFRSPSAVGRRLVTWTGHDFGPSWFLLALLVVSLFFVPVAAARPQLCRRLARPDDAAQILRRSAAVAAAVAAMDVAVWWRWSYADPSPWNANVAHWPQAAGAFALGVLAFRGSWFESVPPLVRRMSGWGVVVGLAGLGALAAVVLTSTADYRRLAGGGHPVSVMFALADGLIAISASLWTAGLFQRRRVRAAAGLTRWMTRGSYATYLLHPPLVVALALLLEHTSWPAGAQLVALTAVGLPCCLLLGAGAVRLPVLSRVL